MSLFANHLKAISASSVSMATKITSEEGDPIEDITVDEDGDGEGDYVPEGDEDQFAEQRARLNNRRTSLAARTTNEEEEEVTVDVDTPHDEPDGDEGTGETGDGDGDEDVDTGEDVDVVVEPDGDAVITSEDENPEGDSDDNVVDITVDEDDDSDESEDESTEEEEAIADDIAKEDKEIEEDIEQIRMLSESAVAIESFGINPSAMAIMQATGLLNGTALESLGLESIGFEAPKAAESQMALEALGDKIKEKSSAMAAKVVSVVKNASDKTLDLISAIWDKISGAVKAAASFTWDKTKLAGKTMKAHPYATIAAIVASIGATAGIIKFTGASLPAFGGKTEALVAFSKSLGERISKITSPFGKFTTKVSESGRIALTWVSKQFSAAKAATVSKLGWTQSSVKSIGGMLSRVKTDLFTGVKAFGTRCLKVVTSAGKGIGGSVTSFMSWVSNIASTVFTTIRSFVLSGLRAIRSTFTATNKTLAVPVS